ncbi:hypothetical protein BRCON_2702 [Candidatus Sumerlaea chitinivorans]|uniref:Uncharacterized protein n=1 Tax=Sumerlaea chitinivorans TaxID=2250252 RepID=A0A2Z4Y870_SUMC1|nr:hypothetical protein BRCON_2702 [Candidatus Sumerlaea chitinivorans]
MEKWVAGEAVSATLSLPKDERRWQVIQYTGVCASSATPVISLLHISCIPSAR